MFVSRTRSNLGLKTQEPQCWRVCASSALSTPFFGTVGDICSEDNGLASYLIPTHILTPKLFSDPWILLCLNSFLLEIILSEYWNTKACFFITKSLDFSVQRSFCTVEFRHSETDYELAENVNNYIFHCTVPILNPSSVPRQWKAQHTGHSIYFRTASS